MEFNIKICDIIIKIKHNFDAIKALCADYTVCDGETAAFCVSASAEELEAEKRVRDHAYSDAVCEATCIHRAITAELVKYGVILMHSAAVAVDGAAYVFMAKSGVGKTTHLRLWLEQFGEHAEVINGDKPYFSFLGEVLTVHGSPWRGKEGLGAPISAPVGGICFIERGEENIIEPASSEYVIGKIFHQVLLPKTAEDSAVFMAIINKIAGTVPFYRLRCNTKPEAALVAFEGMRKDCTQ